MSEVVDPETYDPVAPGILRDPIPAYAALRQGCPVHLHEGLERPMYTFARREDVQSVLTDPELWSNRYGPGIAMGPAVTGDLQRYDPPVHESRRRFLRAPFLPRAVEASRPRIERLAHGLVDQLAPAGRAEIHDDYALPLPVQGFVDMMGVSDADADDLKRWADDLTVGMTFPDRARDARAAMTAYTLAQVRGRRAAVASWRADASASADDDPVGTVVPEGLLSHLSCHPLDDGTFMPDEEVAGMVGQLLVAGHETTTSLITNALWRLLEVPERWARLVREPQLVPNVVEESLRYDAPVLGLCKTNNEPVERHGVTIPEDSKVMVLYASANRDPDTFDGPDEFRIDRPLLEAKKHLSFGWGTHFCLGSHLARLTARTALEVLVERLPSLRADGENERISAPFLWGRSQLHVAWDPAP